MKARIVRIANSKGIRMPKPLIEQTGLTVEVMIETEGNRRAVRMQLSRPLARTCVVLE